jgi:uncharacterized protein YceK
MKKYLPRLISLVAATLLLGGLTGCSAIVSLEAAPESNSYSCAEFSVRLPDTIDKLQKRQTDAQATAAWGNPASVIVRCGLPQVTASKLRCVTASGIDWLIDESSAPTYRFISFGRQPATEVIVDSKHASGANVLDEVSSAVARTKLLRTCSS